MKISRLPLVGRVLDGNERLPIVQDGETRGLSLAMLLNSVAALLPAAFRGPPGGSNATYARLEDVAANIVPEGTDLISIAGAGAASRGLAGERYLADPGIAAARPPFAIIDAANRGFRWLNQGYVTPQNLGAKGDGSYCHTNFQEAVAAALELQVPLVVPAGVYKFGQKVSIKTRAWSGLNAFGAFAPGLEIIGQGPLRSVILSDVNDYALEFAPDLEPYFTFNGTTENGSPVVRGIAGTAAIEIGAGIVGAGLPAGTTVIAKSANTITLSAAATASATVPLTHQLFKASAFSRLHGIGLFGVSGGRHGLRVRGLYNFLAERFIFANFTGNGAQIYCEDGDWDGAVWPEFRHGWFHNNGGWGLDALPADNFNEISFLRLAHAWFQGNGTAEPYQPAINPGINEPASGALRLKTQNAEIDSCGFTINRNVSLLIQGRPGTATTHLVRNTAFENCYDRAVLATGITDLVLDNPHFYANEFYQTRKAVEIVGSNYLVGDVVLRTPRVRISHDNCIAFSNTSLASAAVKAGARIEGGVVWQEFGRAGHTGFIGDWDWSLAASAEEAQLTAAGDVVTLAPSLRGRATRIRNRFGGSQSFETGDFQSVRLRDPGISTGGLAGLNGLFNVYLSDNDRLMALEVSAVAPALSYGFMVKATETGKVFKGRVFVEGAAAKVDGWVNPNWDYGLRAYRWHDAGRVERFKAALPANDTDGALL